MESRQDSSTREATHATLPATAIVTRPPHRIGPVETTPGELFEDFTRPDADGIALIDKYAGGAIFTDTIRTVGLDEDRRALAWIEVDDENVMSLDFAAPPHPEPGARVTVACRIGGASGALMMLTACLVKDR